MNSVILRAGTRYLAGLLLVFSIYMLLRGHNEPGGGLVGGLSAAAAFARASSSASCASSASRSSRAMWWK